MFINLFSFLNFNLFLFLLFALCACDKPTQSNNSPSKESAPSSISTQEYPKEILANINSVADKFFKNSNSAAKKAWIDKQLQAFDSINSIVPDIPIQDFYAIKASSISKGEGNWTESYRIISSQIEAYKNIQSIKLSMPKNVFDFSYEIAKSIAPNDFISQSNEILKWEPLFNSIYSSSNTFSQAEIELIKKYIVSNAKNGNVAISQWFARQLAAKRYINNIIAASDNSVSSAFAKIQSDSPSDFEKQLVSLKSLKNSPNQKSSNTAIFPEEVSTDKDLPQKLEDDLPPLDNKIKFSIFTRRDIDGIISTAVLTKLNSKTVALCTKDFFNGKLPVTLENSLGKIVCSRAYISNDYPLIMLVPDSDVQNFTPIEIISPKYAPKLIDKKISMIAPVGAGFKEIPVKIFSEDQKFLNLTSDTAPRITKDIDVKKLDRDGNKLLIATTISIEAGNNSIVIDPQSGKLVSMAFRKYNPGVLSWTGKTGSIVGNEKMAIPDSDTFIRQFDGTTKKIEAPDSSIVFIRMTSLNDWIPINTESLQNQKTTLRKFTDDNNDFLMFFKRNLYGDMLRSRRLGAIAERYRHRFVSERMSRESYERYYKNYMLDVMYAMRREVSQLSNTNAFYPIYRDEMEYQIALRKAMHDHLADIIKNNDDITNAIHSDLRIRYSDPMKVDSGTALPSTLGGSIGGGF